MAIEWAPASRRSSTSFWRAPFGNQFMLSYSSNKVWDYKASEIGSRTVTIATPSAESNAGAGWVFGLGRLLPVNPPSGDDLNDTQQDLYVSPDGSVHSFYSTRLPESSDSGGKWDGSGGWKGGGTASGFYYARDGTHLRMQHVSELGVDFYIVEFPDAMPEVYDPSLDDEPNPEERCAASSFLTKLTLPTE